LATFPIAVTLMSAALQWVTYVGVFTPTDRSVILSNLTVCVCPTGSADLFPGELPAAPERISSGAPGASTDGHVVLHGAVGALPAGDGTGVDTVVVLTGALRPTVRVLVTLALDTARVRVPLVARKALTHRPPTNILALGSCSANSIHTGVGSASRPAIRTSEISGATFAKSSLSTAATVGVGSAGVLQARVQPARNVRVSDMLRWALADSRSAIVLTDGLLATGRALAGVEPTVGVRVADIVLLALANSGGTIRRAVSVRAAGVGGAGFLATLREWIAYISGAALADGSLPGGRAVGIDSTG